MLTEQDIYLFREGTHSSLHRKARWDQSGIWEGEVPGVLRGQTYKYALTNAHGQLEDRADPFAFHNEVPPHTASRAWSLEYEWDDEEWMRKRREHNAMDAPMSTYELHLGSWRRDAQDRMPTYRDIAQPLAEYLVALGFTHVELMPITEHPFYGSWGYQTTGYFAPSARYGTPQDFMYLVDVLHQAGIGVILDWVPSHFPADKHGLDRFDGTHLYEHADPRRGFHPEWKSNIFNYGRQSSSCAASISPSGASFPTRARSRRSRPRGRRYRGRCMRAGSASR